MMQNSSTANRPLSPCTRLALAGLSAFTAYTAHMVYQYSEQSNVMSSVIGLGIITIGLAAYGTSGSQSTQRPVILGDPNNNDDNNPNNSGNLHQRRPQA